MRDANAHLENRLKALPMLYVPRLTIWQEAKDMVLSVLPHLSACLAFHLAIDGKALGVAVILLTFAVTRRPNV